MSWNGVVDDLRHQLVDVLQTLVCDRVVILTASVSRNGALRSFFAEAGARRVGCVEVDVDLDQPLSSRLASMERQMAEPAEHVVRAVDELDPEHRAVVYAGSFTAQKSFCGRPVLGARTAAEFDAERKDAQAAFLDSEVTARRHTVDLADTRSATEIVANAARAALTVLSGVPDGQLAVGGSHVYLLDRGAADRGAVADVVKRMAADCSTALISPFDAGMPCTYYGFVTNRWIVDFGPFEALVSWNPASCRIHAVGVARPFVADDGDARKALRSVRVVSRRLNRRCGYVGAFCTDGMLRSDGYFVQEINPRVCAGFTLLNRLCGGNLPLALVDLALRERADAAEVELRAPLSMLATVLREQHPVVALWDPELRPMQDALMNSALRSNVGVWLTEVRHTAADGRISFSCLGRQATS